MTLIEQLAAVAHAKRQPKSIDQIADDLGWGLPSLYKALAPDPTINFPARLLIPFMQSTKSIKPLQHMAHRMGCEVVPLKGRAAKKEDMSTLPEAFGVFNSALQRMYAVGEIGDDDYEAVRVFLARVMGHVKTAEKIHTGQGELF